MEALKDTAKLFLVLIGLAMAAYLAVEYWWLWLSLGGIAVVLLVIKYIVNGRFRR